MTKRLTKKEAKDMEEIVKTMHTHGIECGNEISKMVKKWYPNAWTIVPLYRSVLVVNTDGDDIDSGNVTLHTYEDPHWMGEDLTEETLKRRHHSCKVIGQRGGAELYFEDSILGLYCTLPLSKTTVDLLNGEAEKLPKDDEFDWLKLSIKKRRRKG